MIKLSPKLKKLCDYLITNAIYPVIVGGFLRDHFLGIDSKDIDIEVYNVDSLNTLTKLLKPFAKVNEVGKSFGVLKITLDDLDVDFSLPRTEKKVSSGHCGFDVTTHTNIDFKTAAKRRDFSINSMGYDLVTNELLDPYSGYEDLQNKKLSIVDKNSFIEDPLRFFRAVQFCARFEFKPDTQLIEICQNMIKTDVLHELPCERIEEELKKLFLKSKKPSIGLAVLKTFNGFEFFREFKTLDEKSYTNTLEAVDKIKNFLTQTDKRSLTLIYTSLFSNFENITLIDSFLEKITSDKELIKNIKLLFNGYKKITKTKKFTDFELKKFRLEVDFSDLILVLKANSKTLLANELHERATKLNILKTPPSPLIQGRDLLSLGLTPSKEFKTILQECFDAQLNDEFKDHESGMSWVRDYLNSKI